MSSPSSPFRRSLRGPALLVIVLSVLAACGGPAPTPQVLVVTATFTPEPVVQVVTATFTPTPLIVVVTNTFTPEPAVQVVTSTSTPASPPSTPSTEPAPMPLPADSIRPVSPGEGLPDADIHHLWIDPDGHLWVASEAGIFLNAEAGWVQLLTAPVQRIQGIDDQGRVWAIQGDEAAIAAYESPGIWTTYGPEQGWDVPPPAEYLSPGYGDGLVTDAQGGVWLATGRDDLRRFDPAAQSWSRFVATDIGFDPPEEEGYQGHFLADVALSQDRQLWVGDCVGMGEGILGQGIVRWDGQSWLKDPATDGECVLDMERDRAGRMWLGGFDALHQYDPASGSWSRIPLPPWDRRQLVVDISLDPNDNPWVEIMRYGGASAIGAVARYHLQDRGWLLDFEGWFSNLAFGTEGVAWLCSEGTVYRLEGGSLEEVATVGGPECQIVVDGRGRVWVTDHTDLWRSEP